MNEQTKQKLKNAIENHNQQCVNEEDRINVAEVLTEIAKLDNEELEKAVKKNKGNSQS